ncbi:NAD-dependent deacetylase [Desulfuromonas acetoxidans]|uniref:protein acetyllysine N-acetyltransferase n=1 Tax=Desulfuromonas acetoxidans (strain DSM 684 / 11070) TaxID=281689 RepID=Q1K2S4_DESA6|nr:Sir2 family NAD-dependent protein deacetylase [Desulfuromonas acetoxidans]EAT16807.1 Silent information regulator protein Sir2 [Desulfuromonas acetoxidans DSM 684]MBF0644645.1 NAD-dependent deacetylase [Desulfuromonas acetoxidans]NVD23748.1 NAD-dependent deacetylase [Desulfuromonas acetoxidans]NVE15855.1 NAD-dependent deacetylase [Desulfuromonas acetoxidans]
MAQKSLQKAVDYLQQAEALVISTGAGMGVDSGLPDFRGDEGFWNAYPMYKNLGINFYDAANPIHFSRDPEFGWGFYGHRTNLYRETVPHNGFSLLQKWINTLGLDSFVVTSNVDGQFQKAGFDVERIVEVHGSIHHLQCQRPCRRDIWRNNEEIPVDFTTMRAQHLPHCPHCGEIARPNILMFGDFSWIGDRSAAQEKRFNEFLIRHNGKRLVIIEMGAGTAVPTIRHLTQTLAQKPNAIAIRINPREPQISAPNIGLSLGALEGLMAIDQELF